MTNPEDGVVPSFCAAAEKYSMLSGRERGEGGMTLVGSNPSRVDDLEDLSEFVREPAGRTGLTGETGSDAPCGFATDSGVILEDVAGEKNPTFGTLAPGLIGEVAMGENCGSTVGFVTAVNNAAKNRLGPAGLGMIMTSGTGMFVPAYVAMIPWTVSFRCL